MGAMAERLSIWSFALASGITWGVCMLFLGWVAAWFGWSTALVNTLGSLYIGFAPSFLGGIIGLVWGFFDGAIGGAILSCLYNTLKR